MCITPGNLEENGEVLGVLNRPSNHDQLYMTNYDPFHSYIYSIQYRSDLIGISMAFLPLFPHRVSCLGRWMEHLCRANLEFVALMCGGETGCH